MKLVLSKETLVELTADDMAAVVGGADGDSNSCSILSCVTRAFAVPGGGPTPNIDICDVNHG